MSNFKVPQRRKLGSRQIISGACGCKCMPAFSTARIAPYSTAPTVSITAQCAVPDPPTLPTCTVVLQ
jgi:hypothetical protein